MGSGLCSRLTMHEYVPYVLYIHYICNFSAVKGIDVLKMESGLIGCFSDMYYQSGSILAWPGNT